ncbi:SidA/IucD/PvdA family monooxygenase [Streptomyces flavotricini]|uniref:L-lysine N6-monooxygenase MbtG n=1 Tax=Streptomyces flavotricini TaxID=66888 RepID=A0ABS8E821_9ACTN|nr:SidA/IucD/PvdA family monooxygenase [Streptomyces flavotricini]MCC0097295.1 SidA/IucD/PvdA family monooxygenase [Streptomyces flavotricini]
MTTRDTAVQDLVVAGFGPSGIALAAAVEDHDDAAGTAPLAARYLERAADSAWQPNLVLPGTDIQHHFLRDFATPRDARSRFTFPHYLQQSGRFYPFTLMGGYVSRLEWSDYVQWAARQVRGPVDYHREVLSVEPVTGADGRVRTARVLSRDTRDGSLHTVEGRNIALATGHEAYVPELFRPHLGERVFHASKLLPSLAALAASGDRPPRSIAVIGAGQTAGEIVLHLAAQHPDAEIHSVVRHAGFRMYELGHFSNEVYFPDETDYFYGLEGEQRERALDQARATNYAAVDPDVSTALYQAVYQDRFTGRQRLHMHKRTEVTAVDQTPDGRVRLRTEEVFTGGSGLIEADAVIVCTGYREAALPRPLAAFVPHLRLDAQGRPEVTRAYRARTTEDCEVGIYLDGLTEWRHGIGSATSFSQMAAKADTIHRDLRARLRHPVAA